MKIYYKWLFAFIIIVLGLLVVRTLVVTSNSHISTPQVADFSVSCTTIVANDYGASGETVAQVTLATNELVQAADVDVTVIDFNAAGGQTGTETIEFKGPLANGQTFYNQGSNAAASCEVASVSSDASVTYRNLSP